MERLNKLLNPDIYIHITKINIKNILELSTTNKSLLYIDTGCNELETLYEIIEILTINRPLVALSKTSSSPIINSLFNVFEYGFINTTSNYVLFCPSESFEKMFDTFNLYIENDNYCFNPDEDKLYKFYLTCNWETSTNLCRLWNKMRPLGSKVVLQDQPNNEGYSIVINQPLENKGFLPHKTMVFRMEPDCDVNFMDWYKSINIKEKNFMRFFSNTNYRNNTEWHLSETYDELYNTHPEKTKMLSTVLSSLYTMLGHKLRIDFVKFLQEKGVDIDVYGRDNVFNFKNHLGSLEYHNKSPAILPYKYTFIAENCDKQNYFTEKIVDAILGETLCFYWGCSGLEKWISPDAFIRLPLEDKEKSLNILVEAIGNNEWEKRIEVIRREKKKILEYFSFFNRVESYIYMNNAQIMVEGDFSQNEWVEYFNHSVINDVKITKHKEDKKFTIYIHKEYKIENGFNDGLAMLLLRITRENIKLPVYVSGINSIYKVLEAELNTEKVDNWFIKIFP